MSLQGSQVSSNDATRTQVVLAEFAALRQEIQARSSAAQLVMNLNATASAAVAGFVLANKADPLLLLLLPILSPALGMLYVDHAFNITNIGTYIGQELKPVLCQILGGTPVLQYEEVVDVYEKSKLLRFLPLGLPVGILFAVAPTVALLLSWSKVEAEGGWAWAVWSAGIFMIILFLFLWARFLYIPYASRRRSEQ